MQVGYLGLSWLILRWTLKQMDPNRNAEELAKETKEKLVKRLGRKVNLRGVHQEVSMQAGRHW